MTHEAARARCLAHPGATEDLPFGPDALVFRVGGKIFALLALDDHPPTLNLKGDPEANADRRERYDAVTPGYHMDKRHWTTVVLGGEVPTAEVEAWVAESYALVRASLPAKVREGLG